MFSSLVQTPYCGFRCSNTLSLTTLRFDECKKDGRRYQVKVCEPLEPPKLDTLSPNDFSIKVIKDAGLLGTLKECSTIKMCPLDAQEVAMTAVDALDNYEFEHNVKIANQPVKQPIDEPVKNSIENNN